MNYEEPNEFTQALFDWIDGKDQTSNMENTDEMYWLQRERIVLFIEYLDETNQLPKGSNIPLLIEKFMQICVITGSTKG